RAGARLVGAHARADLAGFLERPEGALGVLARVDGVEARDDVEGVLVELHSAVREADRLVVALAPPEDAELVLGAHSEIARRRWRTALASVSSTRSVSSHPMHGSVMETPWASGWPGVRSWRPGFKWLSTI